MNYKLIELAFSVCGEVVCEINATGISYNLYCNGMHSCFKFWSCVFHPKHN